MFHRWFVERTRAVDGATVFNCTEGGARIDGMIHRPLAEVAATLAREVDVAGVLARAEASADAARRARLVAHLAGVARGLARSRRLAVIARALIARGQTGARLVRVEAALAAALAPLSIASLLAQREVERAHDVARRPGEEHDYVAAQAALLATLLEVIDQLGPALAAALARLDNGRTP
jgi:hypothetical protein